MTLFNSIQNLELNEAVLKLRKLRKEYEFELSKKAKKYRKGVIPEREMNKLYDEFFSRENFERILPTDTIIRIKGDMVNEMIVNENNLYNLNHSILKKLGSGYTISFIYIGKCINCGSETGEREIEVESPILDWKYESSPDCLDGFFEATKCTNCNGSTEAVKTVNKFSILEDNEYNIRLTLVRKKSKGRLIPKFVEKISGKQKDIRDIYGLTTICESEDDCKIIPELMLKYSDNGWIECRDFITIMDKKDVGKSDISNLKYILYTNRKGRLKKNNIEPIEIKIRSCVDSKGRKITAPYRAIHMVFPYKGTIIEVQAKDMNEYQQENDPNSPLFHGNYVKSRGYTCGMHYEQISEMEMRRGWSEFEKRLERFLIESDVFGNYSPTLYSGDFTNKK